MKNLIDKLGKILLISSIVFFSLHRKNVIIPEYKDDRIIIVLDPGHGNHNKGNWPMNTSDTVNIEEWGMDLGRAGYENYHETDINLKIAKNVKKMLNPMKYNVILTRENNLIPTPLEFRTEFANEKNANLFISIHTNEYKKRYVRGYEVFYRDSTSREPAELCVKYFGENVNTKNRGTKLDTGKTTTVLKGLNCPGILTESGFITNHRDRKYILDTIPNIESVITKTIDKYFPN